MSVEHGERLMEGADQVLAVGELMPVLPPTEESTWASSVVGIWMKSHAAPQDGGGKAGEVADDAAAQGDDAVAPLDTGGQQLVAEFGQAGVSSWCSRPAA